MESVRDLATEGTEKIIAITPGFVADNIESLYDVNIAARKEFMRHGGKEFVYIPCLNSNALWVDALIKMLG